MFSRWLARTALLLLSLISTTIRFHHIHTIESKESSSTPLQLHPCDKNAIASNPPIKDIALIVNQHFSKWIRNTFSPMIPIKTYYVQFHGDRKQSKCHSNSNKKNYCPSTIPLVPIKVYEITPGTMHLVPVFSSVGFEFMDIALSNSIKIQNHFTMDQYHDWLRKIEKSKIKDLPRIVIDDQGTKILNGIIGDFMNRHGFSDLKYVNVQRLELKQKEDDIGDDRVKGTHPHIDPPYGGGDENDVYGFRLWIPLQGIDNLVLGLGDTNGLVDRECASSEMYKLSKQRREQCVSNDEFERVKWYHQQSMRRQDVIFFANHQVPHFSVNRDVVTRKKVHKTQERSAIIVNLQFRDVHCD